MTPLLTLKVEVKPELKAAFIDWQAKLNAQLMAHPSFLSLEVLSPSETHECHWLLIERFTSKEALAAWRASTDCFELIEELKRLLGPKSVKEEEVEPTRLRGGVTEVIVTQVSPEKAREYRAWMTRLHHAEAHFPGFRGVYVQTPLTSQGTHWLTFLQFDTAKHLDIWLASSERQQLLDEAKELILSYESHRVLSPYAGWFSSLFPDRPAPSITKTTMLILLVLFPIVMLELKFLLPLLSSLNSAAAIFISNAISVTLISWPFLPLAIYFLSWWLSPPHTLFKTTCGTLLLGALYLLEIALFWKLL
jgi:hypothetical protein